MGHQHALRAGGDAEIPIARYGSSNIGRMKHVYRVGLGQRYGRMMQAISGVHFNYSFPAGLWPVLEAVKESKLRGQAQIDDAYFALLQELPALRLADPVSCSASRPRSAARSSPGATCPRASCRWARAR